MVGLGHDAGLKRMHTITTESIQKRQVAPESHIDPRRIS